MNFLEAMGGLFVGYLIVGAIVSILIRGVSDEQCHWLPHLLYAFIGVMTWPIILAEPFFPEIKDALLDPDGSEEPAERSKTD